MAIKEIGHLLTLFFTFNLSLQSLSSEQYVLWEIEEVNTGHGHVCILLPGYKATGVTKV